jgi:hypothetical protein
MAATVDAELSEAEALVQGYQDSPRQYCWTAPSSDRADMLATLARLRRKPWLGILPGVNPKK